MSQWIGCESYHWWQYYNDRGLKIGDHMDEVFGTLRDAGIESWEQAIPSEEEADRLGKLLTEYGLKLPSIYSGGKLHEDAWESTVQDMVRQALLAKGLGATMLVCNPDPISWHEELNKTDEQLRRQAKALRSLTRELGAVGMTLAYHTHSPEMRQSAREFHHMLLATREEGMKLCLDFHWLFRGAGDSQVALEDLLELYGDRVVTTHIRQSHGGVWSESLEDGDLDYAPLVSKL